LQTTVLDGEQMPEIEDGLFIEDFVDPDTLGFAPPVATVPAKIGITGLIEGKPYSAPMPEIEAWAQSSDAEIAQRFYDEVCALAEKNMLKTGVLAGAHYAAMQSVLKQWKSKP